MRPVRPARLADPKTLLVGPDPDNPLAGIDWKVDVLAEGPPETIDSLEEIRLRHDQLLRSDQPDGELRQRQSDARRHQQEEKRAENDRASAGRRRGRGRGARR